MTDKPVRGKILDAASEATLKARHEIYGDPFTDMSVAAEFEVTYRKAAHGKYHPAHDEAIRRVFMKLARIACGAPGHEDSYIDAAAYMAIAAECQVESARRKKPTLMEYMMNEGKTSLRDQLEQENAHAKVSVIGEKDYAARVTLRCTHDETHD
jgi:hypothetical protein